MKEFKIQVPEGYEIDKENSSFEKIFFKKQEDRLPLSVDEIEGRLHYVSGCGFIGEMEAEPGESTPSLHRNNLSTKERAEAFLALMQLVELRDAWNGGWKANWGDRTPKYCIEFYSNGVTLSRRTTGGHRVLAFKSRELRNEFLEQFRDLIETAKELI